MAKWADRWLFCVNKLLSENNEGQYYLVGKKVKKYLTYYYYN